MAEQLYPLWLTLLLLLIAAFALALEQLRQQVALGALRRPLWYACGSLLFLVSVDAALLFRANPALAEGSMSFCGGVYLLLALLVFLAALGLLDAESLLLEGLLKTPERPWWLGGSLLVGLAVLMGELLTYFSNFTEALACWTAAFFLVFSLLIADIIR